jgi:alpha-glucoside transport system substrate-binding protein
MRARLLALLVVAALVVAACGSSNDNDKGSTGTTSKGSSSGKITMMSAGEQNEVDAYQKIFDDLINSKTDYKAEVESVSDFEQQFQIRAKGGTLQVAAAPQPGALPKLADAGQIVSLEDLGFDIPTLEALVSKPFMDLGVYKGKHWGLPTNINLKSMVWYPKKAFDEKGYKVPTTWQELLDLSAKIKADGAAPWCVGLESGGATGWPATDWVEDIMLRTAGPETYDKWWKHEIPFNDPSVKHAMELFGKVMFTDGWVLGGAASTPDVAFADAPKQMFTNPPKCYLHRQANFITAQFPTTAKAGVDYDWFPFPPIDRQGTLYGGELTVVGKNANKANAKDFLNRFIAEDVQCAMGGVAASSRISPNINVTKDCYVNPILAQSADVLTKALKDGTGRFDASDLMPAAVGSGSEWTGMVKYMKEGPSSLDAVLDGIEKSWPASS